MRTSGSDVNLLLPNQAIDRTQKTESESLLTSHPRTSVAWSNHGTSCVLERLSEIVARLVSRCIVSRQQRARESQLQSNQQKYWQPYSIPQGGCRDRRRGRFSRHHQRLRSRQRAIYR